MNTKARSPLLAVLTVVLTFMLLAAAQAQSGGGSSITQRVTELDVNMRLPERRSNGQEVVLVVSGELTVYFDMTRGELREEVTQAYLPEEWPRYLAIVKRVYKAGESFTVPAGHPFHISNEGGEKLAFVTTSLLASTNEDAAAAASFAPSKYSASAGNAYQLSSRQSTNQAERERQLMKALKAFGVAVG